MSTEAPVAPPKQKAPPPPPPPAAKPARSNGLATTPVSNKTFEVSSGVKNRPLKVCIYGTGGIGKSELAANISQLGLRVLFIDADNGSSELDVARAEGVESFEDVRALLCSDLPNQYDAIVCDTLTKIEEWALGWTLANIPKINEKTGDATYVDSIEGYGWGKGYAHAYETMLRLIGDFDAQIRRGRHVITVAHDCISEVPNPSGENWIRYEPRLQSPTSGKNSIRHRIKEWVDHLLFVGYDVMAKKDGKATGSGTRAIYPSELPTHWAKSRTLSSPIVYERGSSKLWELLLKRGE